MPHSKGFTLVELLVAISIIAILSVVGFVAYQNVTSKAKDARMKADIDAIKKAYETNYDPSANSGQGGYKPLSDSNFASGKIPTPPGGGSYLAYIGPGTTTDPLSGQNFKTGAAYKVCAVLSNNTSTCASSTQGDTTLVTQINSLSNPSCDPSGSLALGLVGYWKMDDGSWNIGVPNEVRDSSGNNNHGTAFGGAGNIDSGKFDRGGEFDGTDDYINVGQVLPTDKTKPFTLAAWAWPGAGDWRTVLGTNASLAQIGFGSDNSIRFGQNGGGGWWESTGSSFASTDRWYHIVGVYDGTNARLYVYGELKSGPIARSFTYNHGVSLIGRYSIAGGEWMNGKVDDVRIYNRALEPAEITALYNGGNGCI